MDIPGVIEGLSVLAFWNTASTGCFWSWSLGLAMQIGLPSDDIPTGGEAQEMLKPSFMHVITIVWIAVEELDQSSCSFHHLRYERVE